MLPLFQAHRSPQTPPDVQGPGLIKVASWQRISINTCKTEDCRSLGRFVYAMRAVGNHLVTIVLSSNVCLAYLPPHTKSPILPYYYVLSVCATLSDNYCN